MDRNLLLVAPRASERRLTAQEIAARVALRRRGRGEDVDLAGEEVSALAFGHGAQLGAEQIDYRGFPVRRVEHGLGFLSERPKRREGRRATALSIKAGRRA